MNDEIIIRWEIQKETLKILQSYYKKDFDIIKLFQSQYKKYNQDKFNIDTLVNINNREKEVIKREYIIALKILDAYHINHDEHKFNELLNKYGFDIK